VVWAVNLYKTGLAVLCSFCMKQLANKRGTCQNRVLPFLVLLLEESQTIWLCLQKSRGSFSHWTYWLHSPVQHNWKETFSASHQSDHKSCIFSDIPLIWRSQKKKMLMGKKTSWVFQSSKNVWFDCSLDFR